IGNVQILVAGLLVVVDDVVGELSEDLRSTGESGQESGNVVRSATEEAARCLRPTGAGQTSRFQIVPTMRNEKDSIGFLSAWSVRWHICHLVPRVERDVV